MLLPLFPSLEEELTASDEDWRWRLEISLRELRDLGLIGPIDTWFLLGL